MKRLSIIFILLYLFVGVNNMVWGADSLTAANLYDSYMQDVWNDNNSPAQGVNHTYNYGGFTYMLLGYYDLNCDATKADSNWCYQIDGIDTSAITKFYGDSLVIDSAKHYEYCYQRLIRSGCDYEDLKTYACPILRDWTEGTRTTYGSQAGSVCFQSAKYGTTDWTTEGARSVGNDRMACADDTTTLGSGSVSGWVSWDITEVVKTGIDSSFEKVGWVILTVKPTSDYGGSYYFYSTEYATAGSRPYVMIWSSAAPLAAPTAPLVTTWYSETYNASSYGYANPDTYSTSKGQYITDWTPKFSVISEVDSAHKCQIRVGTAASGSNMEDSIYVFGTGDTTDTDERTPKLQYHGSILQDAVQYHWSARLITTEDDTTAWSVDQTFKGVTPAWPDSTGLNADVADCKYRANIRQWTNHSALSTHHTIGLPKKTGYGVSVDSLANASGGIDGSQQIIEHNDYVYVAYLAYDTSGAMGVYIRKRHFSLDTWSDSYRVRQVTEIHKYGEMIIGEDEKIHLIVNGHNTDIWYHVTDSADGDSGINIENWSAGTQPATFSKSTYIRLVKSSAGHLFAVFRHQETGVGTGFECYSKLTWSGSAYGSWGAKQYFVDYWDNISGASDYCVYTGGVDIDTNDRIWIQIMWRDFYQDANKNRGTSLVYSDMDGSGLFTYWFEIETADTVGETTASRDSAKSISYGNCSKVMECHWPDSAWRPGPVTNIPTLIARPLSAGGPLLSWVIDEYDDPTGDGRPEAPIIVAKWDSTDSHWLLDNLAGRTKFRAKNTGDCDSFWVKIDTGTVSGIKLSYSDKATDTITIDNITTPYQLRDTVNTLDTMVTIQWVGIALPDTFSQAYLDSGGAGRYSYLEATSSSDICQMAWCVNLGGAMIHYYNDLYVYARVKTGGDYSGGEIFEWQCIGIDNEKHTNGWVGKFLSANSGGGVGRISVIPYDFDNRARQVVSCRLRFIDYISTESYSSNRSDGNDLRVVMVRNLGYTLYYYELHRVPDFFGMDTTYMYFKLPSSPTTTIAANAEAPVDKVLQLYWGNPSASNVKANPDSTFRYYQSFEDTASGTNLSGYDGWIVTSASDSATIYSTYDDNYSQANLMNVWNGDQYVYMPINQTCKRVIFQNYTNAEIHVRVFIRDENGDVRVKLINDATWVGLGLDVTDENVTKGNSTAGWSDDTHLCPPGKYYDMKFIINSGGVDCYVDDLEIFTDDNTITAFDTLSIQSTAAYMTIFDAVEITSWVSNDPEPYLTDSQSGHGSRRRKLLSMSIDDWRIR